MTDLPTLSIAGAAIPLSTFGSGAPALLAHGALGDGRTLAPVAQALADTCEAITPTLPFASRPGRPFGTEGQAEDLADIIAALGRGPVHLVAWSFAAHPALALAARRPEWVASLFLYEPGFPTFIGDAALAAEVMDDMTISYARVAAALRAGDTLDAVRHAIDAAAGRAGHFDSQPEAVRRVHADNAHHLPAIFGQTPPVPLTGEDLARIACPVTLARGAATRTSYRIVTDAAAACIAQARHVVVPGAGHLCPEQDPPAFAALIRAHLAAA